MCKVTNEALSPLLNNLNQDYACILNSVVIMHPDVISLFLKVIDVFILWTNPFVGRFFVVYHC